MAAAHINRDASDAQLLEAFVARGDQAAFAALAKRHGPMVLSVCRRVLGHQQDAEDAFQVTFLALARHAARIRKKQALAGWLHGVAYRTALCAKRSAARRRRHEGQVKPMRSSAPSEEITWREVQAVLDEEIRRLPERYRIPFVLCCLEGKSQDQVARDLGLKIGTIGSRLSRGRQQLQEHLSRRGIGAPAALALAGALSQGASAAVPARFLHATVQAALQYAAGKGLAAGLLSAGAIALMKGVTHSMFVSKCKIAVALVIVVGIAAGAGLSTRSVLAGKSTDPEQVVVSQLPPEDETKPDQGNPPPAKQGNGKSPNLDHVEHLICRLGSLPADLVKTKKNVAEMADALFLATLARLPAESERSVAMKHLQQGKDRIEACRDIVWGLLNSHEFLNLHRLDSNVPETLRLLNKLGAEWDAKPAEPARGPALIAKPEAFTSLDHPDCSHCVVEANRRKKDLRADDRVLCWRQVFCDGYTNDGAIPLRFFLNKPYRILNDGWGVFVHDPDAGYARGFRPEGTFSFHGWRNGVMVMKGEDGTLYSCLTGKALQGPKHGHRLEPRATLVTDWAFWHNRYPQALAYTMFDRYQPVELPTEVNEDSRKSRGPADRRLPADTMVLGVWDGIQARAYPLDVLEKAGVLYDNVKDQARVVFWYGPTRTAAAYRPAVFVNGRSPGYIGDGIFTVDPAGGAAPFVDRRTGGHWDITGRGIGGGPMLAWLDSVQVKWFAWAAEYPETSIYGK
jgi:RNA polymerase sigma factor (sigma-70 family)